jgi:hypothetical protein
MHVELPGHDRVKSNKYECAVATLDSKSPFLDASNKQVGLNVQDRTSERVMDSNT